MKASTTLKTMLTRSRLAPLAAIALGLTWGNSGAQAQGPRFGEAKTVQGRVQGLTTAPMGEVDGATLDDGTVVHWPPHLATRFTSVVTRGDRVSVAGRMETGPEGDTHLEAQTVTNLRTNASAEGDFGPPPPPPGPGSRFGPPPPPRGPLGRRGPAGPVIGASKTVEGRIQGLTTAPMGEVDGATLDDGTVIHWPPHLAARFTNAIGRGDRVKVSGWMETGPEGDTHLEAQTVTNLRTNASAGSDIAGPPGAIPDGSADFAVASSTREKDLERQLKQLEDQIAQLREEIRRSRNDR